MTRETHRKRWGAAGSEGRAERAADPPNPTGDTLRARLTREGVLPLAQALDIGRQIAVALSAVHRTGVVQGDLDPAKVLLLPDGTVRIQDPAPAGDIDAAPETGTRRAPGGCRAPEQVLAAGVDARADLWALGVIMYEMLTGRQPFEAADDAGVAAAIVHAVPAPTWTVRGDVTSETDAVVRTLLSKDPAKRYASADTVAGALAALRPATPAPVLLPARRTLAAWIRRRNFAMSAVLAVVVIAAIAWAAWSVRYPLSIDTPHALAVLPFTHADNDEDSRYLAAGLSATIGTELSRLNAFVVPGYATAAEYTRPDTSLVQSARDLGVSAVAGGSVQRTGDRMVLEIRLLDARSNRELWSRRYERDVAEAADIQRAAVRSIVRTLRVEVNDAERTLLDARPTTSAPAYDLYLRGRKAELGSSPRRAADSPDTEQIRRAQSLYERARDLDPDFALARARLALTWMIGAASDDTARARREAARTEAEAALRLRAGLSEAHDALARYWRASDDLPKAVDELMLAIAGAPGSAALRIELADLYASMGRPAEAASELERALQLEPASAHHTYRAATQYLRMRRIQDALRALDRTLALAPDFHEARVLKGHIWLRQQGTPDTLATLLRGIPAEWDPNGMGTWTRYTALRVQRRHRDARVMLDSARSELSRDVSTWQPRALMRAQVYESLGLRAQAREQYESAHALLTDSVAAHPDDARIHIALGLSYAGLGRRRDAIQAARRALELMPVSPDAPATALHGGAVEVFARAGDANAALALLERLFAAPIGSEVTVPFVRVWPGFDPLRRDRRFAPLLEQYATK